MVPQFWHSWTVTLIRHRLNIAHHCTSLHHWEQTLISFLAGGHLALLWLAGRGERCQPIGDQEGSRFGLGILCVGDTNESSKLEVNWNYMKWSFLVKAFDAGWHAKLEVCRLESLASVGTGVGVVWISCARPTTSKPCDYTQTKAAILMTSRSCKELLRCKGLQGEPVNAGDNRWKRVGPWQQVTQRCDIDMVLVALCVAPVGVIFESRHLHASWRGAQLCLLILKASKLFDCPLCTLGYLRYL